MVRVLLLYRTAHSEVCWEKPILIVEDIGVHCLVSSETAGCMVAAVVQLNHTCSETLRPCISCALKANKTKKHFFLQRDFSYSRHIPPLKKGKRYAITHPQSYPIPKFYICDPPRAHLTKSDFLLETIIA